jgi:S1-C subfamily serine protease
MTPIPQVKSDVFVQLIPKPSTGPMLTAFAAPVTETIPTPPTRIRALGMDVVEQGQGVFVRRVAPGSPADQGGLVAGDLLIKFNGGKVLDVKRLLGLVESAPTQTVSVRFARAGMILDRLIELDGGTTGTPGSGAGVASAAAWAYQVPEVGMEVVSLGSNRVAVHRVYKGSYSEQAGLAPGDRVLSFNNKKVRSVRELVDLVGAAPPEQQVPIRLSRAARVLKKKVMIGEGEMETVTVPKDPAPTFAAANAAKTKTTTATAGANATNAPAGNGPYQVPELGMEVVGLGADGVAVFRVYKGSFAEQAGLERGDFIFGFNGKSVRTLTRFLTLVTAAPPEQAVDVRLGRNGRVLSKRVTIGEGEMETAMVPADAAGPYTP